MSPLSAENILRIWETGRDQHPLDRALTMLMADGQGRSRHQLAALPVAQRDEHLIRLREQTFGPVFDVFIQCSRCSEKLEFTLSAADIRSSLENDHHGPEGVEVPLEVVSEDIKVCFRLPDSRDLAEAAGCDDLQDARRLIVRRCVREAYAAGEPMDIDTLPVHALDAAGSKIAQYQQQSEVLLQLQCPACQHNWQMMFDIASFLWTEIAAKAKRLLGEVHILASAYGWREADILSLNPFRRQFYLEAVL
jgi:hypothetical protein